ncbi:MAG TPA: aminoglycoside phosphotransferase family protein [Roseiflexaceae bacterium]|nr:aminoglycoside phosphotransferase family protein [Roseiflexaceae bacterium]
MDADLQQALWDSTSLAGLQWALTGERSNAALREAIAVLLPPASAPGTIRIHRAKYKPGRYLQTYYDVALPDGNRQVEVNWLPAGAADPRGPADERQAMQAEALERGLAAPFRALATEAPDWGMYVQVAPLDVEFPQLVRTSDPQYVGAMLRGVEGTLADAEHRASAIRYRPGQRHVLRYDVVGHPEATLFAKVYNSDKGARTFGVVTRMADWLAAQGGLQTVKPSAYLPDDQLVLYPLVTGTPLSELLRAPGEATNRLLRETGAALAALHRAPLDIIELKPHSFEKEVKGVVSASEHVHPLLPDVGRTIDSLVSRARALHERLPQEPPAFAYGDFKADHLWDTPDGLMLIDFDTCYLFDPAIDLGKFLADIQFWYDGYGHAGAEQAQEQFLAGYGDAPDGRVLRGRLYEALVLLKSTVRRVKLFDPNWASRTTRLIDRASAVLDEIERAA